MSDRKFCLRAFLSLAAINLLVYGAYHLSYHIGVYWFALVIDYFLDAWDCLIPAICALLMLRVYPERGICVTLALGCAFSVARMFYSIPYYYLFYMTEFSAPDSLDSLVTSLLSSLLVLVTFFLHIFALWGLGVLVFRLKTQDANDMLTELSQGEIFNFSYISTRVIFFISLVQFVYALRVPLTNTIDLISDYGLNLRPAEILHIVLGFVFVLCLFVLCHLILSVIRKRLFKSYS